MASPDGLVAALARCQAKFPAIVKSHTNPAFKGSQYADVADVLAAVRPVLAAEGIVVTQSTVTDRETGGVELVTTLMYGTEGEFVSSHFPLHIANLNAQGVGSLMTYHRRYQLCALLGVHPVGDDDDGNLAATAQQAPDEAYEVRAARESTKDAIASLSEAERELVKLEIRNQKIPTLNRPGATGDQLEALSEFIQGLRERREPFELNGEPASPKPDSAEIPFNPVVAVGAADESGTARRSRNSATRTDR